MIKITPLPKPPTTQDSVSFDVRADEFLEVLPKFADELNAFGFSIQTFSNVIEMEIERAIKEGKDRLIKITQEKQKKKRLEA